MTHGSIIGDDINAKMKKHRNQRRWIPELKKRTIRFLW